MRLRYVTGPAHAVVRAGAVVMLPEKVSPELVDELWRTLDRDAGVVPLLEVLTGSFGASLASLPPFAIAVVDDGRVQVAVRGTTSVHVSTVGGERVRVSGESVATWAERTVGDVAELVVGAGATGGDAGGAGAAGRGLPLDAGVVLAASVGVVLREHAAGGDATAAPVRGVPVTAPDAAPESGPEGAPEGASEGVPEGASETAPGPAFEAVPPAAGDDGVPDGVRPDPVAPPAEETSGYGHLWGSTVHRAVEAAAVRPEEEDAEEPDAPGAGTAPEASPETIAPEPGAEAAEAPPETIGAETVAPETQAPETQAPDASADDVDGSTVLSSAIADLRAAATPAAPGAPAAAPGPAFAPSAAPGRPTILARTCAGGHPNPPQRDDCAQCGKALVGEARQVPRPPLGVMAVSSGPRITLDRPVVVGRRPRSPRSTGDDLPRLVTVPSPEQDISRSHVEVRLEGWHVLVSDMSTTNGTTLLRAGQPPMRLHPGEPVLVVSSDVVDLGDGVTLTFEGIV